MSGTPLTMSTFNKLLHGGAVRRKANRYRYRAHKLGAMRGLSHNLYNLKRQSSRRFLLAKRDWLLFEGD